MSSHMLLTENRLAVTEQDNSTITYSYDDIYQLLSETRTGTNPYALSYVYDEVGNRTWKVTNGVTTKNTYDNENRLVTELTGSTTTEYGYDLNGNLISKVVGNDITCYAWDWNNRLVSVSEPSGTTAYQYDGDGTRISKTQNSVPKKYINDVARGLTQVMMETDNTGATQIVYNYGLDLISMKGAGATFYYQHDGLGSTRKIANAGGIPNPTYSYTYDAFGNVISSPITAFFNYGFTGEQQFEEPDGLVNLRARYYKPSIGRFISRDPLGLRTGINYYSYVSNNPINLIDPEGENPITWMYHCIQCFRYLGRAMDRMRICRDQNPIDCQARWRCNMQDPSFMRGSSTLY